VLSTCIGRHQKFGEVSCTECTGQKNDFELMPMVEMENRNPIEGYFDSEFPAIYNYCRVMAAWSCKTLKSFGEFFTFWKNDFYGKISKFCFESYHRHTDRRVVFKFHEIWPTENL